MTAADLHARSSYSIRSPAFSCVTYGEGMNGKVVDFAMDANIHDYGVTYPSHNRERFTEQ